MARYFNMKLTKHVRHARLVKLVRRTYQQDHIGARLWPNTSGVAWQGNAVNGADEVILRHPRPIKFGIPEPGPLGTDQDGSGGADLLGVTIRDIYQLSQSINSVVRGNENPFSRFDLRVGFPIFTAIEIKTGNSQLKKNQKQFREWVLSVNGVHHVARECPNCWEHWEPVKKKGRIVEWIPDKSCPICFGKGYLYDN